MDYDPAVRRRRRWGQGTIYPRRDGRWVAALPNPATGRKDYRYGPTRAAARDLLDELLAARDAGVVLPPAGLTVGDFLRRWLDDGATDGSRGSATLLGYRRMIDARIIPAIGGIPLSRVSVLDVQRYLNRMLAAGRSPFTVKHHLSLLRLAFGAAVSWHLRRDNPAAEARAPKMPRSARPTLDAAEGRRLLEHVAGRADETLYVLALTTGMRQSEILGLAWDDVDLDAGALTVRGQLAGNRVVGWKLVPTKADEVHAIALAPIAVGALRAHRARQLAARLASKGDWPFWGLVFVGPRGLPLAGGTVTARFQRELAAAGLRRMPFHSLRHSTATILLELGVPARVVADVLGHSTTKLTNDTYSHVSAQMTRQAAEAMQRAVGGAS